MIFRTTPEYITILKKIHGILFGVGADGESDSLKWISSNLKYDEFAVPPSLWDIIPQRGKIRHIKLPFDNADIVIESLARRSEIDFETVEAVAFASSFACPIIALSDESMGKFKKISSMIFRGEIPDSNRRKIFYFRNCEDAVADFYVRTSLVCEKYLSGDSNFHTTMQKLRTLALNDAKKRFWQLGDGTQGNEIIAYVDLLQCAEKIDISADELRKFPFWSLVTIFNIG